MGLSTAMEGGLAAVGEAGAKLGAASYLAQQQAEIEALRDARLQQMKLDLDQTTRDRNVADAETERQRVETAATGIAEGKTGLIAERAGLNDADYRGDEGVGVPVQKGQAVPTNRDRMQAQGKYAELAQLEERDKAQSILSERQKSDDEKWRMTYAETKRFHDASIRHQAAQLGLKDKDAKDFNAAVDSYIENKADLDALVSGNAMPDTIAKAKQDVERAALKLKQWKVDPADTSDFAKRLNLSATLTSLNKTIEDVSTDPATVEKAKAARASVIEQMATITGGSKADSVTGAGSSTLPPLSERVVGMVVDGPNGPMRWAGKGWEPVKPGDKTTATDKPAGPIDTQPDFSKDLSYANPSHRAALNALADAKQRLITLTRDGTSDATLQQVRADIKSKQAEVNRLAFAE